MTRTKTLGFRLEVGDKYAAIAAESDTYQQDAAGKWPNGISTTTTAFVEFDSYWREWLGSIRTEHFESSNFFIIASVRSEKPDVLDRENQLISQSVKHFYLAVLLTGRVPFYQKPLLITGGCTEKGTTIRQLSDIECPIQFSGIEQDSLNLSVLERASRLAAKIPQLWADSAKYKRLKRVMNIYWDARTRPDILDRLHEYTRCIEGFIIPSTGQTARQFRSRTELFIGPRHHNLMKSIFDVRSAIEHLNEHLNMASKTRHDRAQIYRWATIAEYIARTCITRAVERHEVNRFFETDHALLEFWRLTESERQEIWGPQIDPFDAIHGFDDRLLSNSELGLPLGP